jgi:hypothetical protein
MVLNCSPTAVNHDETLSTLRHGSRALAIKNSPRVNEGDGFTSPLRAAHEHLKTLRAEHAAAEQRNMLRGIRDMLEVADLGYVVVDSPEEVGGGNEYEEGCDCCYDDESFESESFEVISRNDTMDA